MGSLDGTIMMNDGEEEVPNGAQLPPVAPATKPKITRLHWKEQDEEKLFRQYRVYLDEYEGRDAEMWTQIYDDLVSAGVSVVSVRAAKERCVKTLKEFRATDILDRWKTGDPGQFTPWERLLCDICNHLDDKKKRITQGSQKKTAEQEKQLRKDAKMMHAASHSLKKRKKGPTPTLLPNSDDTIDNSSGELDGEQANASQRERTSYNHCISEFLTSNKTTRSRQLKLDEDRLAFEKAKEKREEAESAHRMQMDRERVELEKKREENATLMAQNAALMAQTLAQALITIQSVKNSSV